MPDSAMPIRLFLRLLLSWLSIPPDMDTEPEPFLVKGSGAGEPLPPPPDWRAAEKDRLRGHGMVEGGGGRSQGMRGEFGR